MDSTSQSLAKARNSEEKRWAKTKSSRRILARACTAKATTWKLESAKGATAHGASSVEASLSRAMWEAKKTTN